MARDVSRGGRVIVQKQNSDQDHCLKRPLMLCGWRTPAVLLLAAVRRTTINRARWHLGKRRTHKHICNTFDYLHYITPKEVGCTCRKRIAKKRKENEVRMKCAPIKSFRILETCPLATQGSKCRHHQALSLLMRRMRRRV